MKLRLKVSKEGSVCFIAHLEYMRAIERALRRAKLPVAWTEGFNPHIRLSLASALGLGIASESEYAEVELVVPVAPAEAQERLNAVLPPGIRVLYADTAEKTPSLSVLLASAAYAADISVADPAMIAQTVDKYNNADSFPYSKQAAPGKPTRQLDLKEYVRRISCRLADSQAKLAFVCRVTPGGTVRANDVLAALGVMNAATEIRRTGLYRDDGQPLIGEYIRYEKPHTD